MNSKDFYHEIINELGMEVYHSYKEGKHAITETILIGLATAILFEFLKGILDFEKLGTKLKDKFQNLVSKKKQLENNNELVQPIPELDEFIDLIMELKGNIVLTDSIAYENVYTYLIQLGLNKKSAKIKAKSLTKKLSKHLE